MSKMADLDITIQEMILEGYEPTVIANVLNVPIEWVEATMVSMEPESGDESFDAFDDAQALASAGWGTDEDYGHYEADF
jgi:hypothetical protein